MARKLRSPTFKTHLANSRCSSELVAMIRMLIWRWRIVACYQRCDRGKEALTMSSRPPLGTTGKIYRKSPPRTTVFPPKIFSVACASCNCIKSRRVRSTTSKARRCIIDASYQMIRSALHTNSATFICCVMLQVDSSCRSIGILNLECAVVPPRCNSWWGNYKHDCRWDKSVVQTNVLPVPPLPYTKNSLPSLSMLANLSLCFVVLFFLRVPDFVYVFLRASLMFFFLPCLWLCKFDLHNHLKHLKAKQSPKKRVCKFVFLFCGSSLS